MSYNLSRTERNLLYFANYLGLRYAADVRMYLIRVSCWQASMPGTYTVRAFKSKDDTIQFGRWCSNNTGLALDIL